ncbi:hypothetical protein Q31a_06000 [Aureliella helgolandensis]|uniref:3-keto-alpha-glucoside-1,2-lyase/3-keto-2-hydroxy-glucal hydratase domain-containing protein n=2 Tax=Aureliella helgolandensis TaxID=2527968 RepID=A0A518G161_9BACT|nr:hypothetical protein Q31a_06000 [Aureliella helgolandensis]
MCNTLPLLRRTVLAKLARSLALASCVWLAGSTAAVAQDKVGAAAEIPRAFLDGTGPGWRTLLEDDFELVNLQENTWTWEGNLAKCTGLPVGVERTKEQFTNFELMAEWRHLSSGGNSGFFIWASPAGMQDLKPGSLPQSGIEVQVLDHGYTEKYESSSGKKGDWFSTHGDIFPVGTSRLKPFPPLSPNGNRSFPSKNLSRPTPQWNHYYVRAINGEVRLWVNGEEVSGGNGAEPATGHICLESEGAPVEFKNIRIRELP